FDPQIPLPRRPEGDLARRTASRGVGLQFRRHHAHARNAHLPAPPEDRTRSIEGRAAGDRCRRLQAGTLRLPGGAKSMSLDRDISLLSRIPIFTDLPTEQLRLLAFSAVRLE